jgi:hypothetical protein
VVATPKLEPPSRMRLTRRGFLTTRTILPGAGPCHVSV